MTQKRGKLCAKVKVSLRSDCDSKTKFRNIVKNIIIKMGKVFTARKSTHLKKKIVAAARERVREYRDSTEEDDSNKELLKSMINSRFTRIFWDFNDFHDLGRG